jgi:2-polyprenyl-6-methoxyphenol hydroxylase-like FAD-dependent oxidoreductase
MSVAIKEGASRRHAVVIGASIGGLLAARALAGVYERVTVLERDTFPAPGEPRKGVPQGRHPHAFLARGREIVEGFFPGITRELVADGALLGDAVRDARWFLDGGYHCRFTSGLLALAITRPRLEARVRARLLELPGVSMLEGRAVEGLVANESATRITGVRARRLGSGTTDVLPADLVVDAGGRGSRTPMWLAALGYATPEEELVHIGVGYTSRFYRRTPDHLGGDRAVVIGASPAGRTRRCGFMVAQEGGTWLVMLGGYFGDHAPADASAFLAFAASLPIPDIHDVIKDAEPVSSFATYTYPASRRRRYERLSRFPEGLLAVGDAIASFNPLYGQGMSVAALEAVVLRRCLAEGSTHLGSRFFKRAGRVIDLPWSIATGGDLRLPEVEARRSARVRLTNSYLGRLQVAARHDPVVTPAFHRVTNLVSPPSSLLRPGIMMRVLRGSVRSGRDRAAHIAGERPIHSTTTRTAA